MKAVAVGCAQAWRLETAQRHPPHLREPRVEFRQVDPQQGSDLLVAAWPAVGTFQGRIGLRKGALFLADRAGRPVETAHRVEHRPADAKFRIGLEGVIATGVVLRDRVDQADDPGVDQIVQRDGGRQPRRQPLRDVFDGGRIRENEPLAVGRGGAGGFQYRGASRGLHGGVFPSRGDPAVLPVVCAPRVRVSANRCPADMPERMQYPYHACGASRHPACEAALRASGRWRAPGEGALGGENCQKNDETLWEG